MTNIWDSELGEDATTNIWDEELGTEPSPEAPPSRSVKEFFTDSLKTYQESQQAMIEAQKPVGEIALGLAGGAASFIPYLGMSAFPVVQNELLISHLAADDRLRERMEKETDEKQKARYAKRLLSPEIRASLETKLKTPREASEAGHALGEKAFSWMPQPETPMGTEVLEKVGGVMERIVKPSKWAGKQIEKVFGVSVGHLSQLALEYFTFHALGKVGKKGVKKAKEGVVKGIEVVKAKRALKKAEVEGTESIMGDFLDDLGIVAEDLNTPEKVVQAKKKIVKEGQDAWTKMQEIRQTEEFKKSKKPIDISKRKAENRIPEEAQKLLDLAKEAKTRGRITPEETQKVLEFTAKVKEGLESKKSRKNQKFIDKILKKEEEFKVEVEAPKEEVPKIDAPKIEILKELPKEKTPLEKQWDEISDRLKIDIEDGLEVARDMGIYETIREEVAKGSKVGEIKKAIKQGEYYAEDLRDFGYNLRDIAEAIRSIKIKEFGDAKVLKDRTKKYEEATKQAEKLKVTELEPEPLKEVKEEIVPEPSKVEDPGEFRDSLMKTLLEEATEKDKKGGKKKEPLKDEPLIEKPEKPKEETWEDVLAEEEPKRPKEEVDMEEYAKERETYSEEMPQKDVVDYFLGDQKGEISITPEHIKKIKEHIKKGLFTPEDLVKGLRARGVSEGEIQKIFPTPLDQKMIEGTKGTVKTSQYGEGLAEEVINKGQKNSKKMEVPQVTRGEVAIVEGVREISAPVFKEDHSLKNPSRTFKDIGTSFKELTYRKILKGQNLVVVEKKALMKKVKILRRSVPYYNHKRIMTYAIAKQKDGVQILKNQGVSKIPKLTPKELKVYEALRSLYEDFYKRTNEARIASGETPFPKTKDYFTFVQDLSYAESMGVGLFEDWRVIEKVIQENKPGSLPSYVHAKFRAGPEKPRKLDLNPFNVFDKYSSKTIEYIHMAPRIAKINELLSERIWPVDSAGRKVAPHTYTFMRLWNDFLAGKIPKDDFTNPVTRNLVHKVNSNVTSAILAGLWRTGIIQPTALVLTHNKIGTYYSIKGIMQTMRPSKWKEAYNKSDHLEGRSFDASLYEALTMDTKLLGKVQKGLTRVGTLHIKLMDQVTAVAGCLGAYEQGLHKFKKLSPELREKRARQYADDVVIETQASAAKSDIAPIQRLSWGKTITGLQTYSINQFGYLVRDVLGLGRRDPLPAKTKVIRAIRLITSVWVLNSLLEDGVGISSPFPTPIRAYRKAIEDGHTGAESFAIFMKEFIEVVPVVGGATKYESSYGGPVADEMRKLLTKGDFKALLKLMGVRGTQQATKSLRAYERGGTATDVALGRWVE